jgi:CheY-like chemotaxis protein
MEESGKIAEAEQSAAERQAPAGKIIVAVDDMFFAAKILGAAQAIGRQVERVKSREQLTEALSGPPASLLILDLNSAQLAALEWIERLKADPRLSAIPIIGFLSHVQVELRDRARELGCDSVMARSAFSQRLPEILSGRLP